MLGKTALCSLLVGKTELHEHGRLHCIFETCQDTAIGDTSFAFSRSYVTPMFSFICRGL
jgi:hypothetical protein